jgi:hypothetical protein
LRQTLGVLLAIGRAGLAFHFQLHQALGGKADRLAQQIGIRGLRVRRFIISSVIGGSSNQVGVSNPTLPTNHR